jgi:hypothetical protein
LGDIVSASFIFIVLLWQLHIDLHQVKIRKAG